MTGLVRRDDWGIPHVVASSVADVALHQGRSVALDRSWQLDHARLKAEGRTASVLGADGLPWDRFARRIRLVQLAERSYAGLDEEAADFVSRFVDGVNDGLASAPPSAEHQLLGTRPEPWEPWTPLAVFAAHHVLFATFPAKLWRDHVASTLGPELGPALALLFHHEGLWASGSNSWVVGAARSASGRPVIGGDPHRTFESPNVYQQVRLTCTDPSDTFDVAGFTFPGVPGVQHFAHAGSVAWGITNAMADYQDVFEESLERRGDEVWAETAQGWQLVPSHVERIAVRGAPGAEETVEVVCTPNGPVFSGGPGRAAWSLRTASYAAGSLGFEALLPLLRSRTTADVVSALQEWVEPVNNLLVADESGDVRQQVVGLVPRRPDVNRHGPVPGWDPGSAWTGWLDDLPGQAVGPDGHLVTANHRMTPDFDRIGVEFAPPGRARRIQALLSERGRFDLDAFAEIHRDVLAGQPAALAAAVTSLERLTPSGAALRDEVAGWDMQLQADSVTAAAYVDIRDNLVARLAADSPLAALDGSSPGPHGEVFAPWFALRTQLWLSLANVLSERGRRTLPAVEDHLRAAVEEVAAAPRRPWGSRHRYQPVHALGVPLAEPPELAGDNDCVRCTGALPGEETVYRGSVARYVWDLGGLDRSGWVVPLGASGDPTSPHFRDQTPQWADGRLLPVAQTG